MTPFIRYVLYGQGVLTHVVSYYINWVKTSWTNRNMYIVYIEKGILQYIEYEGTCKEIYHIIFKQGLWGNEEQRI